MRKTVFGFLVFFLLLRQFSIVAQTLTPAMATKLMQQERVQFIDHLSYASIDSNIHSRILLFVVTEADSIQKTVTADTLLHDVEKVKAIQSLMNFIRELNENIYLRKVDVYDIPDMLESYKLLLASFLKNSGFAHLLKPLSPECCQFLANAFRHYQECGELEDIALYKRIASNPDDILQFLETQPGFRFADSLLVIAAAHDPFKIISCMFQQKPVLQRNICSNTNIYVQQIVSLSGNRNAEELIPFTILLAEKRITTEAILEKRKDITGYFQLLVNTLKNEVTNPADSSFIFLALLRNAIKEKSLLFYVNQINELHNSEDHIRFTAIKNLRIEDIYYIITSCSEELYTSSYLGLYKRLMEQFGPPSADSLFVIVGYDNYRQFMRIAANYNTLPDFLGCMHHEKNAELLKRLISGIESDTDSGLVKAMDIADAFLGLSSVTGISQMIRNELQSNLDRSQSGHLYFGIRLYSILIEVYELVIKRGSVNNLWAYLSYNEILKRKVLQNKKGEIIELVLFYGDEDGVDSFNNFMKLFNNVEKWAISKNETWVIIRSLCDQSLVIYANLPLDRKKGMDLQAQDSLLFFLKQQSIQPVIQIHRGHSYHLGQTLKRLQPSVKLAILGSCGGYNSVLSVVNISPDAQVIVSKKTGSKLINDPMISMINETLINNKDLIWTEVWEKLEIRFSNDEFLLNLFHEYIPPTKNVSLFVLKLFKASGREIQFFPGVL